MALTLGIALLSGTGAGLAGAPAGVSAATHRRVTPPKLPAVCPDAQLAPTASNLVAIGRATICLVNKERVARGLVALAENTRLDRAAKLHSDSMVAKAYFNDVGPGSQTVQQRTLLTGYARAGWGYRVGENIAIGTAASATPAAIVAGWMNQPQHRAVLLRSFYRETGLGVASAVPRGFLNGGPGATFTQTFGVITST
ncbi:MAG: hypothetical protein QOH12_1072 [Solirubrobacteraceae bacterium]|jgi:uncharacterized protein YkwD|nr:hypothetical protein [Solirubrobacteraceae bacterium]